MILTLILKWWKKWTTSAHPIKQFCYFCHEEINAADEKVVGEARKPGKEPRRVLAHRECVWENDLFKPLEKES